MKCSIRKAKKTKAFTLIELVMGIIVFSISMTIIISVIVPQATNSVDPIYQVRAAELAQSLMNEITSKSFDENSDRQGGSVRCGEFSVSCSSTMGPDTGESGRTLYDDVDDYNGLGLGGASEGEIVDTTGLQASNNLYDGFEVDITVGYATGSSVDDPFNKLITLVVTLPNDDQIQFAAYRSNF